METTDIQNENLVILNAVSGRQLVLRVCYADRLDGNVLFILISPPRTDKLKRERLTSCIQSCEI
jgi:hypothetical protein